jgi:hypothetical protein
VLAINWDTWADVGMAVETHVPADLEGRRAQVLESGLTIREGGDAFLRALHANLPQVAVCTKDLEAFVTLMAAPAASASPRAADGRSVRHPRPPLTTGYVAPSRDSERQVCAAFAQALGVDDVGVHDNFFEMGGHSLLAVELMAQLNQQFQTSVPVASLYERLTPGAVAALFEQSIHGRTAPRDAASTRRRATRRPVGAARRRESATNRRQRS